MPALPTTSTSRLVVDYTWRGQAYTTLYRFGTLDSFVIPVAALNAFHAATIASFTPVHAVPGTAVWYPVGETFGVDVAIDAIAAGTGGGDISFYPDALQYQILGRSLGGRRASWYFQGLALAIEADQRSPRVEGGVVGNLFDGFDDLIDAGLTTIGGIPPVLKPYINIVFNDYLTRRARSAG